MKLRKFVAVAFLALGFFTSGSTAEDTGTQEQTPTPAQEETAAPVPALTVEKVAFATAIEDRQPVGEGESFPTTVEKLYFWTLVTGAQEPTDITHHWHFNGEKVSSVTLTLRYPRMRTWSSKTIPAQAGTWKVEVQDASGKVLKEASATVTATDTGTTVEYNTESSTTTGR